MYIIRSGAGTEVGNKQWWKVFSVNIKVLNFTKK